MSKSVYVVAPSIVSEPCLWRVNVFAPAACVNLKNICEKILQPLREFYNLPIKVTSGFRTEQLATMIGSKPTSQHCKGEAVDFEIPSIDNKEVATKIKNEFIFDQLILEYYNDSDINSGWIHVSLKNTPFENDNRKMSLIKDEQGYKEWQ